MNQNEAPSTDLADDISLQPSPFFPGKSAAVAQKGGNLICWNCFHPLSSKFHDLVMGYTIIRVCEDRECVRAAISSNDKSQGLGGAGKIITSG